MLRITLLSVSPTHARYALAGEITEDQLPRLERIVRSAFAYGREVTLDLSQVWRVDRSTARLFAIRTARARPRVQLAGVEKGLLKWLQQESR